MDSFLHIRSRKFPILPGEEDELVNEETYGKALAQYIQQALTGLGYEAPVIYCEDWGWWVDLKSAPFAFGVCVYSGERTAELVEYVCTDGMAKNRMWSWKQFRFIDTTPYREKLLADLSSIFTADDEIEFLGTRDDFPF